MFKNFSKRKNLDIIGSTELVSVENFLNIPAKIDTGADSSAIWASNINVSEDGVLSFSLFGKDSKFYTGEKLERKNFRVLIVRSSNGDEEIRYRTELSVKLGGRKIKAMFTLADRSKNYFPILIGRRTLKNKFLVDVSKRVVEKEQNPKTPTLNKELKENPFKFHQKYIK
ncbi:ATP-dependent zinc protease [Candidatus Saccharibacteria bacterium]|nr:ATP-dependent zinc protease [Candidatus Saccharibacteria bacterium]MBQ6605371.1 ATP-dependent zinc protease [Candidatus Saccharibacteria bacterium]